MRGMWFIDLLKKNFRHRFKFASLSKLPVLDCLFDWIFFKNDELIYLPKDNVVEITVNESIKTPENIVLPSKIVHNFIEQSKVHWVMNFCICRESNKCRNYPIDIGCLFLGEAAKRIDPRLGRLVSREEAHQHIIKAGEAGLVHLIGRNKLDTIWLDIGPEEKLLTVCNCCECCCLWKMLPNLSPIISEKINKMDGVEVHITDNCVGCGTCIDSCFVNAIKIVGGKAIISDDCRGCGRCVEICPFNAIQITIPNLKNIDETYNKINQVVNLK